LSIIPRRCQFDRGDAYHEEIRLWVRLPIVGWKDLRSSQVLGQRSAQMGVFERAQVLRLGRIGRTDLRRLDGQVRLSETAQRQELLIWITKTDF
jgi:hypothetical protein